MGRLTYVDEYLIAHDLSGMVVYRSSRINGRENGKDHDGEDAKDGQKSKAGLDLSMQRLIGVHQGTLVLPHHGYPVIPPCLELIPAIEEKGKGQDHQDHGKDPHKDQNSIEHGLQMCSSDQLGLGLTTSLLSCWRKEGDDY